MKKSKKKSIKKSASKKASASKVKVSKKSLPVKKSVKKIAKKSKPVSKAKPQPVAIKPALTVNPYLTFNGNCEEAFNFYKSVFGGAFKLVSRFKDMPAIPGQEMPEGLQEKIMHMSLPISRETILMGSDANPMMGEVNIGQHLSLSVNATSKNEADKIFNSLSAGGTVTLPIADMFWGSYFGMLVDKFGFIWMVSYEPDAQ